MNFLTPAQRTKAIDTLSRAPDEVLLSAMVEFRKIRHFEEGMKQNVNDMLSELSEDVPQKFDNVNFGIVNLTPKPVFVPQVQIVEAAAPVERKNVSPGLPSIGKIGSTTKDEIMKSLVAGLQPPKKYAEHMKLLWCRDEVQFDGELYFL